MGHVPRLQVVIGQVLEHGVNLDKTVRDRCAGQKRSRAIALQEAAHLHIEVEGALRSVRVVHAHKALAGGRIFEVLELVRFIDHEIVHTHGFEVETHVVAGPLRQLRHLLAVLVEALGQVLDRDAVFALGRAGVVDRPHERVDLFLHDADHVGLGRLDEPKGRVANHHSIKFAGRDAGEEAAAVLFGEVIGSGGKDFCARI